MKSKNEYSEAKQEVLDALDKTPINNKEKIIDIGKKVFQDMHIEFWRLSPENDDMSRNIATEAAMKLKAVYTAFMCELPDGELPKHPHIFEQAEQIQRMRFDYPQVGAGKGRVLERFFELIAKELGVESKEIWAIFLDCMPTLEENLRKSMEEAMQKFEEENNE